MMAKAAHQKHQTHDGDSAALLDWVFYHSIMYKFSITHWTQRTARQNSIAEGGMVISKPIFSPNRRTVRR